MILLRLVMEFNWTQEIEFKMADHRNLLVRLLLLPGNISSIFPCRKYESA